jgi:hypothetical protein
VSPVIKKRLAAIVGEWGGREEMEGLNSDLNSNFTKAFLVRIKPPKPWPGKGKMKPSFKTELNYHLN